MKKIIKRREASAQSNEFGDLHPVLRRIYAGRNVSLSSELDYSLDRMVPFTQLGNVEAAAELLAEAIEAQQRLLIVADYDADGATACALAIRGLRAMGAADVHYLVPDRFVHGYGLSPDVVEMAKERAPDILITVDNGISSIDGVSLARESDIEVLITDHHLPGAVLPDATVIVNPNLPNDPFPSKYLAGVGVMFYQLAALRACLRDRDWFTRQGLQEPNLAAFLDLVALGTVADVVPLDYNNRILVSQGLERIRHGRSVPGIYALLRMARRTPDRISTSDLGFVIGPRLNAAGRLTDMRLGIECLLCDDPLQADDKARHLDDLNRQRRQIQADMQDDALASIDSLDIDHHDLPMGLCLYRQEWHQGVVGILASHIKEKFHRPVIAFADEKDGMLKGSGRSVQGIHLRDVLERIATGNPGLIAKYGGHAMAAGLSIQLDDYEKFCSLFNEEVKIQANHSPLDAVLLSDGELGKDYFTLELAEAVKYASPWGQGFPEPLFDGEFYLRDARIVGDRHLKLQLADEEMDNELEAIAFNYTGEDWPTGLERIRTAYRLDINEYMGRRTVQLVLEYVEPVYS